MEIKRRLLITGASGFLGTNLVMALLEAGHEVVNFDLATPQEPAHGQFHRRGDILNFEEVRAALEEFQPHWVIHLAGRTDCDENTTVEKGYQSNTVGTQNVLRAIKETRSVERVIITSSQYVAGPGRLPQNDADYFPHTIYGQSKVETERLTRAAGLSCPWTLIRPVNIWGPYHARYTREFWEIVRRGWYLHPGVRSPVRAYGYVGNVVWQIQRLLELPEEQISGRTFYVGDRPISIDQWVFGFHRAIRGTNPWVIPYAALRGIASLGDGISKITGKPFYLTSSRLRSMTEDYLVDIEATFRLLGEPPYSLEQGIGETVEWLRREVWK